MTTPDPPPTQAVRACFDFGAHEGDCEPCEGCEACRAAGAECREGCRCDGCVEDAADFAASAWECGG